MVVDMRKLLAISLLLLPILLGGAGSPSKPDPLAVPDWDQVAGLCVNQACNGANRDTGGKTIRNLTAYTSPASPVLVLITIGQSNGTNVAPTPYSPANASAIDNLNMYDGAIYAAADPQLGTNNNSGYTVATAYQNFRTADTLITNGNFTRVLLVPGAIAGTLAADWGSGAYQTLPCMIMTRLSALGIVPGGNVTMAIDWMQGESDGPAGTSAGAYVASVGQVATSFSNCGFVGRFFVNIESITLGVAYTTVQGAQSSMAGTTYGNAAVKAGANLDSLGNTYRNASDHTHFNDAGNAAAAALKITAWHASGAPF
jgi:hypothetical protein